jgi:hypothetical protein
MAALWCGLEATQAHGRDSRMGGERRQRAPASHPGRLAGFTPEHWVPTEAAIHLVVFHTGCCQLNAWPLLQALHGRTLSE